MSSACYRGFLCVTLLHGVLSADEFERRDIQGFQVYVSKAALAEKPEETELGLKHMDNQLFQVQMVVDDERLQELRKVPIWLANGEPKLGIAFHPARSWLTDRGYHPPDTPSMIGVVRGKHYLHESLRQPWLIFHELVHGYDWFTLGSESEYGNAINTDGYQRAMATGKYETALHWDGRDRKPYHATNRMEFFAETSEAFFGTNDIFPFVRAELRDHDPATYKMLSQLWHIDLGARKESEASLLTALDSSPRVTGLDGGSVDSGECAAKHTATDDYVVKSIEGWTVRVHPDVVGDEELAARVLRLLQRDLHYVTRYVPEVAVAALQQTPVWIEADAKDVPHVTYHGSDGWLKVHGRNPDKADSIEIGNATNYLRWFELQPSVLVRQLAYAHYQRAVSDNDGEWAKAFERVNEELLYQEVLRFDGDRVAHPGLSSPVELFVEASETYFGTNDHFPFVRAELQKFDSETAKLIERLWSREPTAD